MGSGTLDAAAEPSFARPVYLAIISKVIRRVAVFLGAEEVVRFAHKLILDSYSPL
jgi:hypothetical protein